MEQQQEQKKTKEEEQIRVVIIVIIVVVLLPSSISFSQEVSRKSLKNLTEILTHSHKKLNCKNTRKTNNTIIKVVISLIHVYKKTMYPNAANTIFGSKAESSPIKV